MTIEEAERIIREYVREKRVDQASTRSPGTYLEALAVLQLAMIDDLRGVPLDKED